MEPRIIEAVLSEGRQVWEHVPSKGLYRYGDIPVQITIFSEEGVVADEYGNSSQLDGTAHLEHLVAQSDHHNALRVPFALTQKYAN